MVAINNALLDILWAWQQRALKYFLCLATNKPFDHQIEEIKNICGLWNVRNVLLCANAMSRLTLSSIVNETINNGDASCHRQMLCGLTSTHWMPCGLSSTLK
jgi:hypothetical protein